MMNTKICKKQYDTAVANFKIYDVTKGCPLDTKICGGIILSQDFYTTSYCIPQDVPCPITNIKIVHKDSIQGEEIVPHFPINSSSKVWHYLPFDDEYVLGASTIDK